MNKDYSHMKLFRAILFIGTVVVAFIALVLCLISIWSDPSTQGQWNATAGAFGCAATAMGFVGVFIAFIIDTGEY